MSEGVLNKRKKDRFRDLKQQTTKKPSADYDDDGEAYDDYRHDKLTQVVLNAFYSWMNAFMMRSISCTCMNA